MRAGATRLVAFRAACSTSSAAATAPLCALDQSATRSARPRNSGSPSSRRVASLIARGESSRRGTESPVPDHATLAAFSPMSPTEGQTSSGFPAASARATVPCPPWQITTSAAGIACE